MPTLVLTQDSWLSVLERMHADVATITGAGTLNSSPARNFAHTGEKRQYRRPVQSAVPTRI